MGVRIHRNTQKGLIDKGRDVVGWFKGRFNRNPRGISNPVPQNFEFARVINPGQVVDIQAGRNPLFSTYPGAGDAFITPSGSIHSGLTRGQAADFLTIPPSNVGGIIRFRVSNGMDLATPINRHIPGFVNGGRTAGGLPEFVIPNQPVGNFDFSLELFP